MEEADQDRGKLTTCYKVLKKRTTKLKKLGVKETLVQSGTVAQVWKVRTLEKEARLAANIEKVPATQKVERSTLKDLKHRGDEKISV